MIDKDENIIKVNRDILFYAFRYSLGRMTYSCTQVMDAIKYNIDKLPDYDIEQYIKEIDEQKKYGYGMECDGRDWIGFKAYLVKELENRRCHQWITKQI